MNIFKTRNIKNNKVFIGVSENENPHHLGAGKYITRAIRKQRPEYWEKTILDRFDRDVPLEEVMKRVEYWIKEFDSDNPKFGYNETIKEAKPKKKKLTRKIQVLLSSDDEDSLNDLIIEKSIEAGSKPISVSRYIRELIINHIIEETVKIK